jgi:hypothetical protein
MIMRLNRVQGGRTNVRMAFRMDHGKTRLAVCLIRAGIWRYGSCITGGDDFDFLNLVLTYGRNQNPRNHQLQ